MKAGFISLGLLLVLLNVAQAGSLYRWVDKDGKVHYGDRPAEDAVAPQQKRFSDAAGGADLPYSVRKASQDFPVTLYVSDKCGDYCVQARALLNKRGIPFGEKNVASKDDIDALKAKTGGDVVPALTVGRTPLSGFEAGKWNSELDIAGYPATAPYGVRPAAAPADKQEAPPPADAETSATEVPATE